MADTDNTPPKIPSMEDLLAIAQRAEEAATKAASAATAATAGRAAADAEGKARGFDMPKELLDEIAQASSALTLQGLRDEFDIVPPTPDSHSANLGSDAGGESQSEPRGGGDGAEGDPAPVTPRNFAQRFLGI